MREAAFPKNSTRTSPTSSRAHTPLSSRRPRIAVARDIRLSSGGLADAVIRGLTDSGVDVIDVGTGGTELIYFGTFHLELDGGIMVRRATIPRTTTAEAGPRRARAD